MIDQQVSLGAGTVLANLRFDERIIKSKVSNIAVETGLVKFGAIIGAGARTGINVSTWPGTKIGAWAWICPGVVVRRDIPEATIVDIEDQLRIVPNRNTGGTIDREDFRRMLFRS